MVFHLFGVSPPLAESLAKKFEAEWKTCARDGCTGKTSTLVMYRANTHEVSTIPVCDEHADTVLKLIETALGRPLEPAEALASGAWTPLDTTEH